MACLRREGNADARTGGFGGFGLLADCKTGMLATEGRNFERRLDHGFTKQVAGVHVHHAVHAAVLRLQQVQHLVEPAERMLLAWLQTRGLYVVRRFLPSVVSAKGDLATLRQGGLQVVCEVSDDAAAGGTKLRGCVRRLHRERQTTH